MPGANRRRIPLEAVVLGLACLACCLPLLGGFAAAAGAVLAAWGVAATGAGPWLTLGAGLVAAAVIVPAWWSWARRRAAQCGGCGGHACAC